MKVFPCDFSVVDGKATAFRLWNQETERYITYKRENEMPD